MAASCGTQSRLTKATIICPRGYVLVLFMCSAVAVQFDCNGYIFSKGFRRINISE